MLDNGELLTEDPVIVQAIANKAAGKNLAPAVGSPELLSPAGMAELHHHRTAQEFQPAVPAGDSRRGEGVLQGRIAARPNVQPAMKMEGLLKAP
jgi:glutathione S-transferase